MEVCVCIQAGDFGVFDKTNSLKILLFLRTKNDVPAESARSDLFCCLFVVRCEPVAEQKRATRNDVVRMATCMQDASRYTNHDANKHDH